MTFRSDEQRHCW